MKFKRLKHAPDVFCKMFCGWRLYNDYPQLAKLGDGLVYIDLLKGESRHNGQIIQLAVAEELRQWFRKDLERYLLPADRISKAALKAELRITQVSRLLRPKTFRLEVVCEGEVTIQQRTYKSKLTDRKEWAGT
jgi:hypothetical protein